MIVLRCRVCTLTLKAVSVTLMEFIIGHFVRASIPSFPRGGSYFSFSLMYNTETPESHTSGEVPIELERVQVVILMARRSDFTELISCLIL